MSRPRDCELAMMTMKRLEYLEKRVIDLERMCRVVPVPNQKVNRATASVEGPELEDEDELDVKPEIVKHHQLKNTDKIVISNKAFDMILNRKLVVQMGARCTENTQNQRHMISSSDVNPDLWLDSPSYSPFGNSNIENEEEITPETKVSYNCQICKMSFDETQNLIKHFLTHSSVENSNICPVCNKVVSSAAVVKNHLRVHIGIRPFKCSQCKKTYTRKEHLKIHQRVHTGERPYSCSFCTQSFIRSTSLDIHIRSHTGKRSFVCPVCGKEFAHHVSLVAHKRFHTGERPYKCSMCLKTFTRSDTLKDHIVRLHNTEKTTYLCSICPKSYSDRKSFVKHEKSHSDCSSLNKSVQGSNVHENGESGEATSKLFTCSICSKEFKSFAKCSYHEKSYHGRTPAYKCKICYKTFKESDDLTKHQQIHTGETPYSCSSCDKKFSNSGTLRTHQKLHSTIERPFKCIYCDKSFKKTEHLKIHERFHTGERPYKCQICSYSFNSRGTLKAHMRVHTGEKPFECFCGKKFQQRAGLINHKRVHSGEKFECPICLKLYVRSDVLKLHIVTVHKTDGKPLLCTRCPDKFTDRLTLEKHEMNHLA